MLVWWGLAGKTSAELGDVAMVVYLAIAFVLPAWVPFAVRGVEPSAGRRTIMTVLTGVGLAASVVLLFSVVRGPVDAGTAPYHIAYQVDIPGGTAMEVLYVVAACGALLVASDRWIRAFGVLNLAAVSVLVWLTVGGFASLWCVWAAVTSVAINLYLREDDRRTDPWVVQPTS